MANPSSQLRPPGVYASYAEPTRGNLNEVDTRIAGFVGVAQKGPVNEVVRVTSFDHFLSVYGANNEFYLTLSVEMFYRNGGKDAHIVRVAHMPDQGKAAEAEHAACAEKVFIDGWGKPTLRVYAQSEGVWGNNVWVAAEHSTGARALLTQDMDVGAGEANVNTTRGFEVGQLVKVHDREGADHVILTEVGERLLRWGSVTPVNRNHRAAAPTHLEVVSFDLHVALRDHKEVFKGLQLHPNARNYAPRVIEQQSSLVRLENLSTSSPPPNNLPATVPSGKITGGRDGTEILTPEDFIGHDNGPADRTGLGALGAVDEVAIVACPDAMIFLDREPGPGGELRSQRVQDAIIDQCESLKDRFGLIDCPQTRDIEVVKRWRRRADSSYCAFYWPWIGVWAGRGRSRQIPPSGIMAGLYARVEGDTGVHCAPANEDIRGAVELSVRVTEDDLGVLNSEGINGFRLSRGIRPWGARTASSDPDWRYVNVRRLFIMVRRSLEAGMGWVPFENNDYKTWESIESSVGTFLGDLFQRGMFVGGKAEDAFFVRCSAETNPPEAVAKGMLTCEVGIAPSVPAEFIMISLVERMPEY